MSANLTPDVTGVGSWSAPQIEHALGAGVAKSGRALCPPMPGAAFARLTSADRTDIAAYLRAIPGVGNAVARRCASR